MSKKILITGATGHYGGGLAQGLATSGFTSEIAVLVRDSESERSNGLAKLGFEIRQGSYTDPSSLERAFQDIEVLFFVSASDIEGRQAQHLNVLEAARKAGISHIIYTSAGHKNTAADGPLYPVMSAHIETEKWLQSSGINFTILRHNLYAEVIPMFVGDKAALTQSQTLFYPAANGLTAFVAREDLIEAGVKIVKEIDRHINKIYAFNGKVNLDFEKVASCIAEITGTPIAYVSPDITSYKNIMEGYGVPAPIIDLLLMFAQGIAQGEFETTDNDLPGILGRAPIDLATFLQRAYV
ncbi:MAG: SDR family oxidoreductase [Saprospiraceae bacterium]|nr:SDR family oxidoreductase [Saprospiraceae bacterium]